MFRSGSTRRRTSRRSTFTVVGVIVVFCCVMLINSLYAATTYRSRKSGSNGWWVRRQGQVLGAVGAEGLILTVTGVFLGTVAGLGGVVAFSAVRTGSPWPGQGPGIWLAVVAVATAVTLGTVLFTARRTLRTPAVAAVTLVA